MPVQVTDGQAVHPASVSRLSCRIFHGQVVPQPVGFYLQDAGAGTLFLPVFPERYPAAFSVPSTVTLRSRSIVSTVLPLSSCILRPFSPSRAIRHNGS